MVVFNGVRRFYDCSLCFFMIFLVFLAFLCFSLRFLGFPCFSCVLLGRASPRAKSRGVGGGRFAFLPLLAHCVGTPRHQDTGALAKETCAEPELTPTTALHEVEQSPYLL